MSLGLELSKCLFANEPGLLQCDAEATGRSAAAVADLLGCVLANVCVMRGPEDYEKAIRMTMKRVHEGAMSTAARAREAADSGGAPHVQ